MNTDYTDSHMKKLTNVGINDIFPLYLHSCGIKSECRMKRTGEVICRQRLSGI